MASKPQISLIIPHFNNGNYFSDCYLSLLDQDCTNWEAIIVDDCSTDNSLEQINALVKGDERFKLYTNDNNKGIGYTKRKCIELSSAPIFAFLDPDDTLLSTALSQITQAHSTYPQAGLIYSNLINCDASLNEISIHKAKQVTDLNDLSYLNFNGEISHFASFKRSFYNKTSGVDPYMQLAEDKDIFMKMCEIGPTKHLDLVLYKYRIHNKGASTNQNAEKALFWHWVALIKMAERRNLNIQDLFFEKFVQKNKYKEVAEALNRLEENKLVKIVRKIKSVINL